MLFENVGNTEAVAELHMRANIIAHELHRFRLSITSPSPYSCPTGSRKAREFTMGREWSGSH
jgi:hypothetical protein